MSINYFINILYFYYFIILSKYFSIDRVFLYTDFYYSPYVDDYLYLYPERGQSTNGVYILQTIFHNLDLFRQKNQIGLLTFLDAVNYN